MNIIKIIFLILLKVIIPLMMVKNLKIIILNFILNQIKLIQKKIINFLKQFLKYKLNKIVMFKANNLKYRLRKLISIRVKMWNNKELSKNNNLFVTLINYYF